MAEPVQRRSVAALRRAAQRCRACPLWKNATQTVFGEGPDRASIMLVGEQPGDREDIEGRPFVGPAGRLLDRALDEAGIPRQRAYVTNAVKHFKFEPRGKSRIHKKPSDREIAACHDWLEGEIELMKPAVIVVLGATALRAILGRAATVSSTRGRILDFAPGTSLLVTAHPSYLLRVPGEARTTEYRRFVADLRLATKFLDA
jgi:uracil-DNA glycosylase family protein